MLEVMLRNDPILRARLVEGKWVAYPPGEAIFKNEFSEGRHIRGEVKVVDDVAVKSIGILPHPDHPIVLSYDLGGRNVSVSFQQHIPTEDGILRLVFDELCYVGEKIPTRRLAIALLEKLAFWTAWLREVTPPPVIPEELQREIAAGMVDPPKLIRPAWCIWHVAGDDATTVYRPNTGSTDAQAIQRITAELIEEDKEAYDGIEPFVFRACPRPPGSIKTRVDSLAHDLMLDLVAVSELCPWHRDMLLKLERDPNDESVPRPKQKFIHTFDAFTYGAFYQRVKLPDGYVDTRGAICSVSN